MSLTFDNLIQDISHFQHQSQTSIPTITYIQYFGIPSIPSFETSSLSVLRDQLQNKFVQYFPIENVDIPHQFISNQVKLKDIVLPNIGLKLLINFLKKNRPKLAQHVPHWYKLGDWICSSCYAMNWSSKTTCHSCEHEISKGNHHMLNNYHSNLELGQILPGLTENLLSTGSVRVVLLSGKLLRRDKTGFFPAEEELTANSDYLSSQPIEELLKLNDNIDQLGYHLLPSLFDEKAAIPTRKPTTTTSKLSAQRQAWLDWDEPQTLSPIDNSFPPSPSTDSSATLVSWANDPLALLELGDLSLTDNESALDMGTPCSTLFDLSPSSTIFSFQSTKLKVESAHIRVNSQPLNLPPYLHFQHRGVQLVKEHSDTPVSTYREPEKLGTLYCSRDNVLGLDLFANVKGTTILQSKLTDTSSRLRNNSCPAFLNRR